MHHLNRSFGSTVATAGLLFRAILNRRLGWLAIVWILHLPNLNAQFYRTNYVTNSSFETVALAPGDTIAYGNDSQPVDGWAYSGLAGIAKDSLTKTSVFTTESLGVHPFGNYAYLLPSPASSLEQVIDLPLSGGYLLQYYNPAAHAGYRVGFDVTVIDSQGQVRGAANVPDGNHYYDLSMPISVTVPGPHTLRFSNVVNVVGTNNAVLLDNVTIARTSYASLTNRDFEAVTLNAGQFRYQGTLPQPIDSWAFAGNAGIATDSTGKGGFATAYVGRYPGTNYAFLQTAAGTAGSIEQSFTVPITGPWLTSFNFAGRRTGNGFGGNARFRLSLLDRDGSTLISTQLVATSDQLFTNRALPFFANHTGPYTLRFHDLQNVSGTDNTVLIDDVQVLAPAQYALVMVPNSFIDIVNTSDSRWYFFSAPTPAPARMSRMNANQTTESPWGSNEFGPDGNFVRNRIFPGEILRIYAESVPTNSTISLEASYTPLGERFTFDVRVADSPFVRSIRILDPTPTGADTVHWAVTLSQEAVGVSPYNFAFFNPARISGPTVTDVRGSGSNWIVTASTGTGFGLLGLNWVATADERPNVPIKFTGQVYDFNTLPYYVLEPESTNVVVGSPVTLRVSAQIRGGGTPTYQWYEGEFNNGVAIGGATNTSLLLPATTNDYVRKFFVRVANGPGSQRDSAVATVRAITPPTIVTQPADQLINAGERATLSVVAIGTQPINYEWYRGPLGDTSIPLAGGATLSAPIVQSYSQFWVRVQNLAGPNYAQTSRVASVSVAARITQQPAGFTACPGASARFVAAFSLPNPDRTIQWQQRLPGGEFTDIPDATNTTYVTAAATPADDGTTFRLRVSSSETNMFTQDAALSVITLTQPTAAYDFSRGLPAGSALYGNALFGGAILLTPPFPGQNGAWLMPDLTPGRAIRGFVARFEATIGRSVSSPFPADGFSFNWASDLPNGTYAVAEEGEGSGLRVCFDTFDNGGGEAPAIDVKWGSQVIGHFATNQVLLPGGNEPAEVMIRLNTDGTLDLTYRCVSIFTRLPIPGYTPLYNSRFGFGARTGQYFASHAIDNLSLQLVEDSTNGVPRLTHIESPSPNTVTLHGTGPIDAQFPLFASEDLRQWHYRAQVSLNGQGQFEFVEPDLPSPSQRFYRLHAAPHLPRPLRVPRFSSPSEQKDVEIQVKTVLSVEAIRTITAIGSRTKWNPGSERGKVMSTKFSQTINFKR